MIRTTIIAPTLALRAGLRALLTAPDISVGGEAAALHGALYDTDLLLLTGSDLAGLAAALPADARVAALTLSDDPRAAEALRGLPLRGWGLLPADVDAPELQAAARAAVSGLIVVHPALSGRLFGRTPSVTPLSEPDAEPLTAREREVLDLLAQGLPNKLIARDLQISEHTVKFHISSIFAKLGAASRTEAISRGARQGLITL